LEFTGDGNGFREAVRSAQSLEKELGLSADLTQEARKGFEKYRRILKARGK
jgi:hypothetical protein